VIEVHHILLKCEPAKETINTTTNEKLRRAKIQPNKDKTPQQRWEKGLPKYDPQSETTIDSCL
jgi:hypothetical protein